MLNIYVANLGKYNEGELVGEWLTLPATQEEIEALYVRIKVGTYDENGEYKHGYTEGWSFYEETAIHDYETDIDGLEIGEWDSIDELNEIAETMEGLDESEREVVEALLEEGYNLEESLKKKDDCIVWSDCRNMTDVAWHYVEECDVLHGAPEHLKNYFDYEAYGRDMSFEGRYIFTNAGNCVEIPR